MGTRTAWLALGLLAACGRPNTISEADYPDLTAHASCLRSRECARGDFESSYFSLSDCEAQISLLLSTSADASDKAGCDYDGSQAAVVYGQILDLSCEDIYKGKYFDDAVEVFDCGAIGTPQPGTS